MPMRPVLLVLGGLVATSALLLASCLRTPALPPTGATSPLAFTLTANDGSPYPLAQHRGKVVLLVNTASQCGFTGQYAALQQLWSTYRERGLIIIGVPSNDFFGQEPGSNEEIASFCRTRFGVTFPIMAKVDVKGPQQIPLYTYLTRESPFPGDVSWNFNKFLVDRSGALVARLGSRTVPDDPVLITAIEAALAAPAPAHGG
jgi:glutathione peroxidase